MKGRPLSEQAIAWSIAAAFVLVFVFPVMDAALFSAEFLDRGARPGLLAPALILADVRNRQALIMALAGGVAAVVIACLAGTLLGLACVRSNARMSRTIQGLALFSGRMPVWVFPACVAAAGTSVSGGSRWAETHVAFWVLWVGWWGATRIATKLRDAARAVPGAEWDAARTLAQGSAMTLRMVLKPRVARDFRTEAKLVAAACLFDPSAVFFLGLSNWPIGQVARCLADGGVAMMVEAAAWLLWLLLIWATIAYVARIAAGDRARFDPDELFFDRTASGLRAENVPVSAKFRILLIPALWPLAFLAVLTVRAISGSAAGTTTLAIAHVAKGDWQARASALSGSILILAWLASVFLIARRVRIDRLSRFVNELTSAWPLEAAIVAIAVVAAGASRQVESSSGSAFLVRFGSDLWLPLFVLTAFGGLAERFRRRSPVWDDRLNSTDDRTCAAADSARTLGLSRRQAATLVRRTQRYGDPRIGPASVAIGAWWLWFSPSWALLPTWRIAAVPIGGQVLVDRFRAPVHSHAFVPTLGFVLSVAAGIALLGGFRSLLNAESRRKRKS